MRSVDLVWEDGVLRAAYQLLHRLQGQYIPCLGVVRLCIAPEPTSSSHYRRRPRTSLEYIPGPGMEKLKSDVGVSEPGAERISSDVMAGLCAIEALTV